MHLEAVNLERSERQAICQREQPPNEQETKAKSPSLTNKIKCKQLSRASEKTKDREKLKVLCYRESSFCSLSSSSSNKKRSAGNWTFLKVACLLILLNMFSVVNCSVHNLNHETMSKTETHLNSLSSHQLVSNHKVYTLNSLHGH